MSAGAPSKDDSPTYTTAGASRCSVEEVEEEEDAFILVSVEVEVDVDVYEVELIDVFDTPAPAAVAITAGPSSILLTTREMRVAGVGDTLPSPVVGSATISPGPAAAKHFPRHGSVAAIRSSREGQARGGPCAKKARIRTHEETRYTSMVRRRQIQKRDSVGDRGR